MRCKVCEYRLWNLAARHCPECGTAFRPSEFEFVLNSVRFLCPHCQQDYYGTGEDGHLEPIEFDCVRCGQHIHMDQMIVLPTQDVAEVQTQVDRNPWLERKGWGAIKAWFVMIGRGMFAPVRLMRSTLPTSSAWSAIWFACLTIFLYAVVGGGVLMLFPFFTMLGAGGGGGTGATFMAIFLAAPTVGVMLLMGIWGLLAHAILRASGDTAYEIGRTFQAIGYSSGANVFTALPCLSFYLAPIGWIWWGVSATLMLREGQKVSGLRATAAGVGPPLLAVFILVGVLAFAIYSAMSMATTVMGSLSQASQTTVSDITTAIVDHAAGNNGAGPDHAARLLMAQGATLTSFDFIVQPSMTNPGAIMVGPLQLMVFETSTVDQQNRALQAAVAALPDKVVAHRLGDVVFTYHGIDLTSADPQLWILVTDPDPTTRAAQPGFLKQDQAIIGLADGSTLLVDLVDFPQLLIQQNLLRKSVNLSPLPEPATVTHAQPAAAP